MSLAAARNCARASRPRHDKPFGPWPIVRCCTGSTHCSPGSVARRFRFSTSAAVTVTGCAASSAGQRPRHCRRIDRARPQPGRRSHRRRGHALQAQSVGSARIYSLTRRRSPFILSSALSSLIILPSRHCPFLQWMERHAKIGWFMSLSRAAVPYHFFRVFSKLVRLHPFVQHDGPVSIARSFFPDDWQAFCAAAALEPSRGRGSRNHQPARLCVSPAKDAESRYDRARWPSRSSGHWRRSRRLHGRHPPGPGRPPASRSSRKSATAHHKVCGKVLGREA